MSHNDEVWAISADQLLGRPSVAPWSTLGVTATEAAELLG